jgi:uncharacterized membrane protein YfcA
LRDALPGIVWTLLGAAVGTWAVQQIDPRLLNVVIPFLLLAIAVYMVVTPALGENDSPPAMRRGVFYGIAGTVLGFYDGFFGPGVGSFWAIAFVTALGFGLRKATGYTKVMNFTSNVVSLFLFLVGGHLLFVAGIVMAGGQIAGARIGSHLVIKRGVRFIRPILITMVILTALKLIYDRIS